MRISSKGEIVMNELKKDFMNISNSDSNYIGG